MKDYQRHYEALESDGYIGIPIDVYTYHDGNTTSESAPVLYVINTNTERIGKDSDEEIISDMVKRGLIVVVFDYKNNEKAVCPALDWSIQALRTEIDNSGRFLCGAPYKKKYNYVVPSGYNITLDEYYWSIDKHGSDGAIDKIVEIWNNDFRGVKGAKEISYPDGSKTTVKEVVAESIFDCVRPDGRQLDFDLRMDIIYPTRPDRRVPVMTLYSSSEIRIDAWTIPTRPHLTGFLFSGYAGAVFDYGYTPMSRTDHYGYFDGNGTLSGSITGDNYVYSADVFTGVKSTTAAIRKLRYLAEPEDTKYYFDLNKFATYGNSKGGLCTRLGVPNAEKMQEQRWFVGHHGETRYENGDTETVSLVTKHGTHYTVHGGEPQPWLTYRDGTAIPSNVQFVYSNCGGGYEDIMEGHAPTFASGSMKDGSYGYFYNGVVNHCRRYDVPLVNFSMPELAHGLVYGVDKDYGVDGYKALFDMAHYYLKGDGAVCEYISFKNEVCPYIEVKFSGSVTKSEAERIAVTVNGSTVHGAWSDSYGRTTWCFTPDSLEYGAEYTVKVPKSLICENGADLKAEKVYSFKTEEKNALKPLKLNSCENGAFVFFEKCKEFLEFTVKNDASNTIEIYAYEVGNVGKKLGEVQIIGVGNYSFDISEYFGNTAGFYLKAKYSADERVTKISPADIRLSPLADYDINEENGKSSLKINYFNEFTGFMPYHSYHYNHNSIGSFYIIDRPLKNEDLGRRFQITFSVLDTDARTFRAYSSPWVSRDHDQIDFNAKMLAVRTEKGKSIACKIDWRIDKEKYIKHDQRTLNIQCETRTKEQMLPITLSDITVKEIITDVVFDFEGFATV